MIMGFKNVYFVRWEVALVYLVNVGLQDLLVSDFLDSQTKSIVQGNGLVWDLYNIQPQPIKGEETKLVKKPTQTSIGNLGEPNLLGRGGSVSDLGSTAYLTNTVGSVFYLGAIRTKLIYVRP